MTKLIPQQTTPLTKFVRTTEGWLVIGFNAALGAAAVFGSLPGTQAIKWGGIVTTATVISRAGLKAIASTSPFLGAPILPDDAEPETEAEVLAADPLAQERHEDRSNADGTEARDSAVPAASTQAYEPLPGA